MALSRVKTWIAGEVLTASDLNAEFNNLLNNARDLVSPLTGVLDMNGFELIMDGDADSSLTADTNNRLDVRLGGVDVFVFNGTAASVVNGLTFFGTATGANAYIQANGTDANTSITLKDANGNELIITAAVASAVNEVTITNAATANRPVVAASGSDSNVGLGVRPKGTGAGASVIIQDGSGNEVLIADVATASAVNEITITNAATANAPAIKASGGDTDIGIKLTPKGAGTLALSSGLLDLSASGAGQIAFPATQNASANANTLDDYEEGSWTPSLGGNTTYTTQVGKYTKVGNLVTVKGQIVVNAIGTGSTGVISGLPFAAAAGFSQDASVGFFSASATIYTWIGGFVTASTSAITLVATAAAVASVTNPATVFGSGTNIVFSMTYVT